MDREQRLELIERELRDRFGDKGEEMFFRAPGRVDLMGSHTDYNEGFILAATVDRDILAAVRPRKSEVLNLYSINTDLEVRINDFDLKYDEQHGWANYVKGVVKELLELKVPFHGMDMVVHGDIPVGGNLSSSAALEALSCESALWASGAEMAKWEKVHLCWRAENVFVGLPCGIMDQFSVIMGEENAALMLDCRSLDFETVPLQLEGASLLVIDSGQGRELVGSKYSERVDECKRAVKILGRRNKKIKSLRDAGREDLEACKPELGDILYRRARHVITENERVRRAAESLKAGDAAGLGRIMEEGYRSCRDDYENSTPELNILHALLSETKGILGSRICGAGWGGCLLALADKAEAEDIYKETLATYGNKTGLTGSAYLVKATAGAGAL